MYHAIVARIARRNFERVNDHDYEPLLSACTDDIHHRFGGNHALGGGRHDKDHLRHWFHRLGRLAADLRLTVTDVWVKGLPHDTTVVMRWTAAITLADGRPCANHGVHIVTMRWGRVTAIDANEDSQVVDAYLTWLGQQGVAEATAAPITS